MNKQANSPGFEPALPHEQPDFNLKDNQKQLDTSFCNVLIAVIVRRFHNYRRNKKALFNEVVLPSLIVIAGFVLALSAPAFRSDSAVQTWKRLPKP
jgi:hypothetical protein